MPFYPKAYLSKYKVTLLENRNYTLLVILIIVTAVAVSAADAAGIPKKAISTVAKFIESDLPTTTVFTDTANSYTAGDKQTFQASSTTAGLNFAGVASDPSSLSAGDVWRNTASDSLKFRSGGGTQTLATLGQTQIFTGATTMNSLTLGGNAAAGGFRITGLGAPTASTDASNANNLGLLGNVVVGKCSDGQILKYQNSNATWTCQSDNAGITSLNSDSTPAQTISGTSGNITVSDAGASHTVGLGSNVVVINKPFTISSADTFSGGAKITGFSEAEVGNKTSAYSASATDDVINVDDSSASVTITLPTPVDGKTYTIKKVDASLNTVTIAADSGDTIDGQSSITLNNYQEKVTVQSNGHHWFTLSHVGDDVDSFRIRGSTASRYFTSALTQYTDVIGGTPTATTLNAYPFIVSKTMKIDQIGLVVSTAGGAGSTCRVGIYTDTGNTAPNTLVTGSDGGTLAVTATGLKTNTVSITLQGNNLYWLAYECSTASTLKLTTLPITVVPNVLGIVPTGSAVASGTGYSATNTYGALPASYPASGRAVLVVAPTELVVRISS